MNEFEKLEAELKELRPLPPSEQFHARLEKALGDAGNVALCCLPDEEEVPRASTASKGSIISFPRLITFAGLSGLGLAAVWAIIFYLSSSIFPDKPGESANPEDSLLVQSEMAKLSPPEKEDPDSPLHGLSLDQIQDISVMPVSGWSEPQNNERFLRLVDEGIFNLSLIHI